MKRLFVSILAILYLASASGATVHLHYCMGKLTGMSLEADAGNRCSHCGMKKKAGNDCCKSDQKTIKVNDAHILAAGIALGEAQQPATLSVPYTHHYSIPLYAQCVRDIKPFYSPPSSWRSCPIYIVVRNFRI